MTDSSLPIDLGDGLVLRSATPEDAERLGEFNAVIHTDVPGEPDAGVAVWTRDLLLRPHPTFRPELFTVVEERGSGRIVSSLNLIPQTWSYGGIEVGVGRIELVGTEAGFRRRGLVRRQFEVAHRWSAERGHLLQGITGIPWYYRQFGYEMTLALDGSRRVPVAEVPALAAGEAERYRVRPATPADVPFVTAADAHGRGRYLVACVRDEALWRLELDGHSAESGIAAALSVVETAEERPKPVGFVAHARRPGQGSLWVTACELAAGVSWLAVGPGLLRGLRAFGEAAVAAGPVAGEKEPPRFERIVLYLNDGHPLYAALPRRGVATGAPYAWFIRVPDLPALLRRVAPVLEARLPGSGGEGYTGELRLCFYRGGLRLTFAEGGLTGVEEWPEASYDEAGASFPPLTFLHLVFGHRSLAELERAFADCVTRTVEARAVLEALFPVRTSQVWPVA